MLILLAVDACTVANRVDTRIIYHFRFSGIIVCIYSSRISDRAAYKTNDQGSIQTIKYDTQQNILSFSAVSYHQTVAKT